MEGRDITDFGNYTACKDRSNAIDGLKNDKGVRIQSFDLPFNGCINNFYLFFEGFNAVERTGNGNI